MIAWGSTGKGEGKAAGWLPVSNAPNPDDSACTASAFMAVAVAQHAASKSLGVFLDFHY